MLWLFPLCILSAAVCASDELYKEATSILLNTVSGQHSDVQYAIELLEQAASAYKHAPSIHTLAQLSLFGNFTTFPDFISAKHYLEQAVSHGCADGMTFFYLAWIEEEGLAGEPRNPAKSLSLLLSSVLHDGCPFSHMALASKHSMGSGVPVDCHAAAFHYYSATEQVLQDTSFLIHPGRSWPRVKLTQSGSDDELSQGVARDDLLQYYHLTAYTDPEIQILLGQLYFFGANGVDINYNLARIYFEMAADQQVPMSFGFLGFIYLHGLGVEPDPDTAFGYFSRGKELGHHLSWYGLGMMYLNGSGITKQNMEEAVYCLTKAADKDSVDANYQLAKIYLGSSASGLKKIKALTHLQFSASNGHLKALQLLGTLKYLESPEFTCSEVKKYSKLIAERVFGGLVHEAYKDHMDGYNTMACIKYMLAAFLGFDVATVNAAYLLEQDSAYDRALVYWKRAANQGDAYARVKAGDYYYYGLDSKVDYEMAAQLYLIAEGVFHPQAAFNLGYMYENGLGVSKDHLLAKRYYDRALEFNPKAWIPVTLALLKLYIKSIWTKDDVPRALPVEPKRKGKQYNKQQGFFSTIWAWFSGYRWLWAYLQRVLLTLLVALTVVHYIRNIIMVWRFGAVDEVQDVQPEGGDPVAEEEERPPGARSGTEADSGSQAKSEEPQGNLQDAEEEDKARFLSSRPLSAFYSKMQEELDARNQLRKRTHNGDEQDEE